MTSVIAKNCIPVTRRFQLHDRPSLSSHIPAPEFPRNNNLSEKMSTALFQFPTETSKKSLRKVLRMSVNLNFLDSMRLRARSIDVSTDGMTMMSPLQIANGMICNIDFNVPIDGRFPLVRALSKCTSSICVGTQGFRTSLKFIEIDSSSRQILVNLMRYRF